jgi:hypothetical protein
MSGGCSAAAWRMHVGAAGRLIAHRLQLEAWTALSAQKRVRDALRR